MIPQITDHAEQARAKLTERYKRLQLYRAWVDSHVNRWQELEDAGYPLLDILDLGDDGDPSTWPDMARLLIIAKIVGQPALSTVADLRAAILVRILVNRSSGQLFQLARICALLYGSTVLRERQPCYVRVEPSSVQSPQSAALRASLLRAAKAAGVGMSVITDVDSQEYGEDYVPFSYSDGARDSGTDGFSDLTLATGGSFASAL